MPMRMPDLRPPVQFVAVRKQADTSLDMLPGGWYSFYIASDTSLPLRMKGVMPMDLASPMGVTKVSR